MQVKLVDILNEPTAATAAPDNSQELHRLAQRLRSAEEDAAGLRQALRNQVAWQPSNKRMHGVACLKATATGVGLAFSMGAIEDGAPVLGCTSLHEMHACHALQLCSSIINCQ
jgi:hypothetical protein